MRRIFFAFLMFLTTLGVNAIITVPLKGTVIKPSNPDIVYTGRISFTNPDRPAWNFPGIQIIAAFEGTSLRMIAKPKSGYFMAQIDQAEPFKVAFRGERDSVVTLATALTDGRHLVRLMYVIEGYEFFPSSGALSWTRADSWSTPPFFHQERSNSSALPSPAAMATKV